MKKNFIGLIALLLLVCQNSMAQTGSQYFITEWDTRLDTTGTGKDIYFLGAGRNYTIIVSGLDTTYSNTLTSVNGNVHIDVPKAGSYTVMAASGTGTFDGYANYGGGSGAPQTDVRDMLTKIVQWGNTEWHKLNFNMADNLDIIATDIPNISKLTDLQEAFAYCFALRGNASIGKWDVSNISVMYKMFQGDQLFDQDLSAWNLKSAVNLAQMFSYTGMSKCNYTKTLNGWAANTNTASKVFFDSQDERQFSDSTGRHTLISAKSWRIAGDVYEPGGNCTQTTVAVTFGSIGAIISGSNLVVNWETKSEANTDHFDIEISSDSTTFNKVGSTATLATGGTSSSSLQYTFSSPVNGITALTGVSFATLGLIFLIFPGRKNRHYVLFLLSLVLIVTASCKKNNETAPVNNSKIAYVRIKQVNKSGDAAYSKVVPVVKD